MRKSQVQEPSHLGQSLPKVTRQRKLWSDEAMSKALEQISLGKLSVRKAAEAYHIPRWEIHAVYVSF
jgi:hypothetical protein